MLKKTHAFWLPIEMIVIHFYKVIASRPINWSEFQMLLFHWNKNAKKSHMTNIIVSSNELRMNKSIPIIRLHTYTHTLAYSVYGNICLTLKKRTINRLQSTRKTNKNAAYFTNKIEWKKKSELNKLRFFNKMQKNEQILAPATICMMRYAHIAHSVHRVRVQTHTHIIYCCDVIAFIILVPWAVPLFYFTFFFLLIKARTIRIMHLSLHSAVTDTNCINNTFSYCCCCSYKINANCDSEHKET